MFTLGSEETFLPPYFDQRPPIAKEIQEAIDGALRANDEGAIWHLMDSFQANEQVLATITDSVYRTKVVKDDSQQHCEIFMVPVICDYIQELGPDNPAWPLVAADLNKTLNLSFEPGMGLALFQGVTPFDSVAAYTPSVWQAHLNRATARAEPAFAKYTSEEIALPPNAPKLGFITMAGIRSNRWPDIQPPSFLSHTRSRTIIQHTLAMALPDACNSSDSMPIVIAAQRAQFAITDGINFWISQLHEKVGILGYVVQPSLQAIDVTKITLKLAGRKPFYTQFVIRSHQIGPQGVADVLSMLSALAENLESTEQSVVKPH